MALTVESNFKTINDHMQEIFLGKYVLPEFQRTFIWNYERVKSLWESLYGGYPIGQLMFWGEATIDFPVRSIGLNQDEIKEVKDIEKVKVIVDGQQRLSSIWLVLRGDIKLFFNLEKGIFTFDPNGQNNISLDILRNRTYDKAKKCLFFFFNATQYQKENFGEHLNTLNSIFIITKIPFQLVTNTDYNTVVSIFNKLNQQGVKLTDGQIALATISKLWKGVFRKTFLLMKKVNINLNYIKNENPDLIIQAWTGVHTNQHLIKHLAPESSKSKYFTSNQTEYEKSWSKLELAFDKSIDILRTKFDLTNYQFIPGFYPLVVMVNYLANHPGASKDELDLLCKWFIQSMILSRYAIRSITRFREDIKSTQEGKKIQDLFTHNYEPLNPNAFSLKDSDIMSASFKSSLATLLYILMRKSNAVDFYEMNILIGDNLNDNHAWEFHHIFPDSIFDGKRQQIKDLIDNAEENGSEEDIKKLQDELRKLNESINSIPNLTFLIPPTNQSIKDTKPDVYLKDLLQRKNGGNFLERHFIPLDENLWRLNNFEEFRKQRAQLIITKVNEYLKNENLI